MAQLQASEGRLEFPAVVDGPRSKTENQNQDAKPLRTQHDIACHWKLRVRLMFAPVDPPQIERSAGKVRQPKTNVLTTEL